MAKTDEERKSFLQDLRSRHFETPEVTETSVVVNDTNVTGEKSSLLCHKIWKTLQ